MATDDGQRGHPDEQQRARAAQAAQIWDRVGQFLEQGSVVGTRMANRNLVLWNQVSQHLRDGTYTADEVATDAVSALNLAMVNLNDLWSAVTRPPERERVAVPMPTAFLFFDRRDETSHVLVDPTLIRVTVPEGLQLPPQAQIALSGGPGGPADPGEPGPAELLRQRLVATLADPGVYRLDVISPEPEVELVAGTYDGLVYITDPPWPLADLRVVVEGPPPSV
jgi:hypothetical protein